mmetsp:Transcript_8515/g.18255  ORF Transcript_8515/g.18255 Transcript_8515/m.18255 type:complete len:248 (-) Transcript_8515:684-1427(-)
MDSGIDPYSEGLVDDRFHFRGGKFRRRGMGNRWPFLKNQRANGIFSKEGEVHRFDCAGWFDGVVVVVVVSFDGRDVNAIVVMVAIIAIFGGAIVVRHSANTIVQRKGKGSLSHIFHEGCQRLFLFLFVTLSFVFLLLFHFLLCPSRRRRGRKRETDIPLGKSTKQPPHLVFHSRIFVKSQGRLEVIGQDVVGVRNGGCRFPEGVVEIEGDDFDGGGGSFGSGGRHGGLVAVVIDVVIAVAINVVITK